MVDDDVRGAVRDPLDWVRTNRYLVAALQRYAVAPDTGDKQVVDDLAKGIGCMVLPVLRKAAWPCARHLSCATSAIPGRTWGENVRVDVHTGPGGPGFTVTVERVRDGSGRAGSIGLAVSRRDGSVVATSSVAVDQGGRLDRDDMDAVQPDLLAGLMASLLDAGWGAHAAGGGPGTRGGGSESEWGACFTGNHKHGRRQ